MLSELEKISEKITRNATKNDIKIKSIFLKPKTIAMNKKENEL